MENQGGMAMGEFALSHLSDEALLAELGRVSRAHKLVTAKLVAHIAEVDARKLYLVRASPSMFAYCVERLGFSEDEACRRIDAARVGRKWPVILGRIAAGEISLTVISKLKPFLNDENVLALLDAVAGKSVREAERILAARFPRPDTPDSIRKLPGSTGSRSSTAGLGSAERGAVPEPERKTEKDDASETIAASGTGRGAAGLGAETTASVASAVEGANAADVPRTKTGAHVSRPAERPVDRGRMQPLSEDRIQVKFTATRALEEKLELARDLMSHSNPRGDLATVIEAALDVLIAERMKKKLGGTKRAQKRARPAKKGRITSATRREVLERDGLACAFVDGEGRRCGARAFLELDHVDPKGKGGSGETENVRFLCHAHNQLEAEREYGRAHMEQKRKRKSSEVVVRDGAARERFGVGLGDPRRRGYASWAGRTNSRTVPVGNGSEPVVRDGAARERFGVEWAIRGGADARRGLAGRIRERCRLEMVQSGLIGMGLAHERLEVGVGDPRRRGYASWAGRTNPRTMPPDESENDAGWKWFGAGCSGWGRARAVRSRSGRSAAARIRRRRRRAR